MRMFATTLLLAVVVFAAMGGAARADYVYGYAGPGEWFSPGEGHGSAYDNLCGKWVDNNFAKPSNAWGLVTFINTSGGWSYTQQAYGYIFRSLPNHHWTKKLHCKNNTGATYQGGCFGFRRAYSCA